MAFTSLFYQLKPFIPRTVQIYLRRKIATAIRAKNENSWPVCSDCATAPPGWSGWPGGKKFGLVLTHDVETAKGHDRCLELMELEQQLGFRSCFNFVPERYDVSKKLRNQLVEAGFEVGVHGLNHDGKLFSSKKIFQQRAEKINNYLKSWNAVGFRAPSMHHNLDWIAELNIDYDMSTFDTDPFEPQSDGIKTIFPVRIYNPQKSKVYLELPYTLPQDFSLFIVLQEKTNAIWKTKLDWIAEKGGMALINTHPDYMTFGNTNQHLQAEYSVDHYHDFLLNISTKYKSEYWHGLPGEIASMNLKKNLSLKEEKLIWS